MVSHSLTIRHREKTIDFVNKMVKGKRRTNVPRSSTRSSGCRVVSHDEASCLADGLKAAKDSRLDLPITVDTATRRTCQAAVLPSVNGLLTVNGVASSKGGRLTSRKKDTITDYFSPARSPITADDADTASFVTSIDDEPCNAAIKTARLARTNSTDTQLLCNQAFTIDDEPCNAAIKTARLTRANSTDTQVLCNQAFTIDDEPCNAAIKTARLARTNSTDTQVLCNQAFTGMGRSSAIIPATDVLQVSGTGVHKSRDSAHTNNCVISCNRKSLISAVCVDPDMKNDNHLTALKTVQGEQHINCHLSPYKNLRHPRYQQCHQPAATIVLDDDEGIVHVDVESPNLKTSKAVESSCKNICGFDGSDSDDDCVVIKDDNVPYHIDSRGANDFSGFTTATTRTSVTETTSRGLQAASGRSSAVFTNCTSSTSSSSNMQDVCQSLPVSSSNNLHCDNFTCCSSSNSSCSNSSSNCNSFENIAGAACDICNSDCSHVSDKINFCVTESVGCNSDGAIALKSLCDMYCGNDKVCSVVPCRRNSLLTSHITENSDTHQLEMMSNTLQSRHDATTRNLGASSSNKANTISKSSQKSPSINCYSSLRAKSFGNSNCVTSPPLVDLTWPGDSSLSLSTQPKLSHSSPKVQQPFLNRDVSSVNSHHEAASSMSKGNNDAKDSTVTMMSEVRSLSSDSQSRNDCDIKTRSTSPSLKVGIQSGASPTPPSTPHKIQVVDVKGFLSPTAVTAISRLTVTSPKDRAEESRCKGEGSSSRWRPRGKGRKRLNVNSVDFTSETSNTRYSSTNKDGTICSAPPADASPAKCAEADTSTHCQLRSRTRSPVKGNGFLHDTLLSSKSHGLNHVGVSPAKGVHREALVTSKINGFVRPLTRTARQQPEQPSNKCQTTTLRSGSATTTTKPSVADYGSPLSGKARKCIKTPTVNKDGTKNSQLTDFFPIRRSERKPKATLLHERQMDIEKKIIEGSEEGLRVENFGAKGRGVVTTRLFRKGDFVIEYVGELLDMKDAKIRESKYAEDSSKGCYMYYFTYNEAQYCIDGTEETGYLGRLVNHSRNNNNLVTKSVCVDGVPHLILVARKDILPGTELLYDYGDRSKEALVNHPWLAF